MMIRFNAYNQDNNKSSRKMEIHNKYESKLDRIKIKNVIAIEHKKVINNIVVLSSRLMNWWENNELSMLACIVNIGAFFSIGVGEISAIPVETSPITTILPSTIDESSLNKKFFLLLSINFLTEYTS